MSVLPALILAVLAAGAAWSVRTLTLDGAAAAAPVGALILAAGWSWALVLMTFFVGSSALSRVGPRRAELESAKGDTRDAAQVLANGAIPACAATAHLLGLPGPWALLYTGALAAATADTWATEIGRHSRSAPRLIVSGRRVASGVSGGVTQLGTAASVLGAAVIALAGAILGLYPAHSALPVGFAGVTGAVVDSVLGATVQERRYCALCGLVTEQPTHRVCGASTSVVGGIPGLNNDTVNLVASGAGAAAALLLSLAR